MTRTTLLEDRHTSHLYRAKPLQEALDAMWVLLENRSEDLFRMTELNEEVCVLDEDVLQQLVTLEPDYFLEHFGSYEEHDAENQRYEWRNLPDYLVGTYIIRGHYSTSGHLLSNPKLTYFFSEEV